MTWHIARTMTKIEHVRSQTKFGTASRELYRPVVPKKPTFCEDVRDLSDVAIVWCTQDVSRATAEFASSGHDIPYGF